MSEATSRTSVRGAGFDGYIDCIKHNTSRERVHHAAPPPLDGYIEDDRCHHRGARNRR
jgi:hypothetical protein